MLERLKKKLSMTALATRQIGRQDIATQMLPGLARPTLSVGQRKRSNSSIMTAFMRPEYLPSLPTLFSKSTTPSTAHVPIGYSPDPCVSCGEPLLFSESMRGPNDSIHHRQCLKACSKCEEDLEDKGARWYIYSKEGLMRCLCKECWMKGRRQDATDA